MSIRRLAAQHEPPYELFPLIHICLDSDPRSFTQEKPEGTWRSFFHRMIEPIDTPFTISGGIVILS